MLNEARHKNVNKYLNIPEEDVIRYYNIEKLSAQKIADIFGTSETPIYGILMKHGIASRPKRERYKLINDKFFDVIDTHTKAYILGLLFADGCNSGRKFSIKLQESDKHILEEIIIAMDSNHSLVYTRLSNPNHSNMYRLEITSPYLCDRLAELGCTPRKSATLEYPTEMPIEYENSFILGYFDGDGSILTGEGGMFKMAGTKPFLEAVQSILVNNCQLNQYTKLDVSQKTSYIYTLRYGGRHQVRRIRDYIYRNCPIFLYRKKIKFYSIGEK